VLTKPWSRVRYVDGTAEDLPLADGSADVVWCIATAHHLHDLDAALDEIRRVLGPGGRLVVIEKRRAEDVRGLASHGWTEAQAAAFADTCAAHSFVEVRVDEGRGRGPALSVVALRGS
jgi:ubiquinone/menaquinone biosynthesis C-methylase UbiE